MTIIQQHDEAVTLDAIQWFVDLLAPSFIGDYPSLIEKRRLMPDMVLLAAAQKGYPVAMLVPLECAYPPMHLYN
jgi:hypothetical protein